MKGFITDSQGKMYSIAALRSDPNAEEAMMRNKNMELVSEKGEVLRWKDISNTMQLTLREKKPPDKDVEGGCFNLSSHLKKQDRSDLWKNASSSSIPAMMAMSWVPVVVNKKTTKRKNTVLVDTPVRFKPELNQSHHNTLWNLDCNAVCEPIGGVVIYSEKSNELFCGASESGAISAVSLNEVRLKYDSCDRKIAAVPPQDLKSYTVLPPGCRLRNLHPIGESEICAVANTNCTELFLVKRARSVTLPVGICLSSTIQKGTNNLMFGTQDGVFRVNLQNFDLKNLRTRRPVTSILSEPEGGVTYIGQRGGTLAHIDWRIGKFLNYYNTNKKERSTATSLALLETHPHLLAARYSDESLKLWDVRNTTRHVCDLIPPSVGFHPSAVVQSWSGQLLSNFTNSLVLHSPNSSVAVASISVPEDLQSLAAIPLENSISPSLWVGLEDHTHAVCNSDPQHLS